MLEGCSDDTILDVLACCSMIVCWSAVYGIGVLSGTYMTPHSMEWTSQECAADSL